MATNSHAQKQIIKTSKELKWVVEEEMIKKIFSYDRKYYILECITFPRNTPNLLPVWSSFQTIRFL
jgi:hypothetical protein